MLIDNIGHLVHHNIDFNIDQQCLENKAFSDHHRYFKIAGITILVKSDLVITQNTFHDKFASFFADGPGDDTVIICHHFGIPDIKNEYYGIELYRNSPWAIFRFDDSFIYLGISPETDDLSLHLLALFSSDHSRLSIYNDLFRQQMWYEGSLTSLTMFPTDQILIARLLADRQACYLHSAAAIINGSGVLFVGHSETGKSTTTNFLIDADKKNDIQVEILCDDRNIVRHLEDGWHVFGTWSHGDVPLVSSAGAPVKAILFIEQANENVISHISDRKEIINRLLSCVIRSFITNDWWIKTLDIIQLIAQQVPCYVMRFDKSGAIVTEIKQIIAAEPPSTMSS